MQAPTYTLQNVINDRTEGLRDFVGPLDVILSLLAKEKNAIKDIKLALILEQYLEYLSHMESMDIEVTSEFVAMAAHLVYLKTRELLQEQTQEELSEMEQFLLLLQERQNAERLAALKAVSPLLLDNYERSSGTFTREPEPLEKDRAYRYNHNKDDLLQAMLGISAADGAQKYAASSIANIVPKPVFSVQRKLTQISETLKNFGQIKLRDLFRLSKSRSEIVATFLAVLELCRQSAVRLLGRRTDVKIVYDDSDPLSKRSVV